MLIAKDMLQVRSSKHTLGEAKSVLQWMKEEMHECKEALDIYALGISLDDMQELLASIETIRPYKGCKARLIVSQQTWPAPARAQWKKMVEYASICDVDVMVRSYDFAPSFCIVRINGKMVTGNYVPNSSGSNTLMVLEKGNGTTFDTFMGYFNSLWGYMTKPVPMVA